MREVEKKDAQGGSSKDSNKASMKNKGKALQNRLSKVESQIKQLEKDIQHDDKMLASNYNKNIEDASFLKHITKESRVG
jgi:ATP-binding cassette subfamily F protein 3